MKKLVVVAMAAAALSAAAMFTEAEFAKASKDVQAALKTQIASWQRGEIADGAVTVADVALRAAWFRADITPPVGTALGGYGPNDVSVAVHDPLYACGLALCNGGEKVMLVALDVLGMDACVIRDMRVRLARGFGTKPANVMLTCTHNHEGPHTRQINEGNPRMKLSYGLDDASVKVDSAYLRRVSDVLAAAVDELSDTGRWREVLLGYYSAQVDENCNRRFTTVDNRASFIAHRRTLKAVATGIADKEMGVVALLDPKTADPLYIVGNYAAHPLAAHAPGLGGYRISADFPGAFRDYIRSETGAESMFVNGACGDLVPKGDELGFGAARRLGETLAMSALASFIDIQRNQGRFVQKSPRLGGEIRSFTSRMRRNWAETYGADEITLDIQCLAFGDVCFVGVPGELVTELGLEIKWHSPFRRTFVAYCATGYEGYISPPNLMAAGGYEPQSQRFACRDTLKLLATASDAMFDLRGRLFPESNAGDEPYPDCLRPPIVDIPATFKATKSTGKRHKE